MSEHLHSLPELHSCSLSEHSLLFELRSTATSFPFLLTSAPNPHVPIPTLSFNPPLSVAGSLMFTPPPLSLPPQLLVPNPPDPALPTTTLLYPTQHIFGRRSKRAFPLKSGTLLIFSRLLSNDFTISWYLFLCFQSFWPDYMMSALAIFQNFIQEVLRLWEMFNLNKQKGSVVSQSPDVVPADRQNGKT